MKTKLLFLLFLSTCFVSSASAVLQLRVNTATKEFALFGSDTGIPHDLGGAGLVSWSLRDVGGTTNSVIDYDNDVAFSTDVGQPGGLAGFDTVIASQHFSGGSLIFQISVTKAENQTITGSTVYQSYAGLDAQGEAKLEAAIGESLILGAISSGEGFGVVNVRDAAIPEPAHYTMLFCGAMLAFAIRRRAKQSVR